jgi:hypothetical protein
MYIHPGYLHQYSFFFFFVVCFNLIPVECTRCEWTGRFVSFSVSFFVSFRFVSFRLISFLGCLAARDRRQVRTPSPVAARNRDGEINFRRVSSQHPLLPTHLTSPHVAGRMLGRSAMHSLPFPNHK